MFSDEANIVKRKLKKKYSKPCYLLGFTSAKDFEILWNEFLGYKLKFSCPSFPFKLGTSLITKRRVKIHEVYIISHGKITGTKGNATGYMNFEDGSNVYARETDSFNYQKDILVSKLKRKTIKKITFSSCNTANPDCYNIANAFIKKMNVKQVDGFDGGAYFDYKTKKLKKGEGSQPTWNKYVDKQLTLQFGLPTMYVYKPTRERMGLRKYRNGRWSAIRKIYYNIA